MADDLLLLEDGSTFLEVQDSTDTLQLEVDEGVLPADRITVWNPGLMSVGGIPTSRPIFTTLTPGSIGSDNGFAVQLAINTCPVGQVVVLAAGTWTFASTSALIINKGITLRGAGAGVTILQKLNGATNNSFIPGPNSAPLIFVQTSGGLAGPVNLTADAVKGTTSITVADATGFAAGELLGIDELSGAAFRTDPQGRGQVYRSADSRVVWNYFNPPGPADDFSPGDPPGAGNLGEAWCRADRPQSEIKEITSVVGNTINFTPALHFSYRTSHTAQATSIASVEGAGVEHLTMTNGDNGNLWFIQARRCWAKGIESTQWLNEGINFIACYQCELRDSYLHETVWPVPGGGGYAISFAFGSSDVLIENIISVKANKVMVARCSGAGSVVGYCYMDMGYINGSEGWIEIGLNASHMVGPHHVLFEGNYGQNADSDKTHGNSTYMTYFRNHLRGIRAAFTDIDGTAIDDATQTGNGPRRCGGPAAYGYWFNFVGNVMGAAGQHSGWVYETTFIANVPGIWMMGWDDFSPYPVDPGVASTIIRDGNYDHLTSSQQWHNGTPRTIPDSLYLTSKPAFFGSNTWPWVDPATGETDILPAKARFDAGTPNDITIPDGGVTPTPSPGGAGFVHTFTRKKWRELQALIAAERAARVKADRVTKPEKQEALLEAAAAAEEAIRLAEIEGTNKRLDALLVRNADALRAAIRASTEIKLQKEAAHAIEISNIIAKRQAEDEEDEMISLLLLQ